MNMRTQFVTDNNGKKVAVILPIKDYQKILEDLEDLEDIRSYDLSKSSNDISIPIDEAFNLIEEKRAKI